MTKSFTLYVDESGDSGTSKIRSSKSRGASQFMVLGGVLIEDNLKEQLASSLQQIREHLSLEYLHCQSLKHHKQVYCARAVGELDLTCFGVISDKKTLQGHSQIEGQEAFCHYNKCVQYLLERLCKYIEQEGIDPNLVSVVFEKTGALRLPQLIKFVDICVNNPWRPQSKILEILNTSKFIVQKKQDAPLLQYADLIANSLYQCVNKSRANCEIPETRYINELRTRFWGDPKSNLINGFGIKPIHNLGDLNLDVEVREFFCALKNR